MWRLSVTECYEISKHCFSTCKMAKKKCHGWQHTKDICWFSWLTYCQTLIRNIKVLLAGKRTVIVLLLFLLTAEMLGWWLIERDWFGRHPFPVLANLFLMKNAKVQIAGDIFFASACDGSLLSHYLSLREKDLSTM